MKKQGKIIIILLFFLIIPNILVNRATRAEEKPLAQVSPRPKIEYKAEDLQEPFGEGEEQTEGAVERKPAQIEPLPTLTIQGIVWGGTLPQAIIENKVVKIGDTINDVRIVDINKDGLVLFYHGQQYNLSSPAKTDLKKPQNIEGGVKNEK